MTQTFFFYGEKPATLNLSLLTQEVHQIAPDALIEFHPARSWSFWQYNEKLRPEDWIKPEWEPASPESPWSHPDVLIFRNVPEQYTRAQVRNFLLNHVATETDEQKERRIDADRALDRIMQNASRGKKAEFVAWLQGA